MIGDGMQASKLLITSMRDEGPYLLEWVAYHIMIGFDHLLVYTNDCTDGTDKMLDRLAQLGLVTHEANKIGKQGVQWSALKQASAHPLTRKAEWLLFADVDEFVNIKIGNGHVEDLIGAVPEADAIALTWRLFGNSGVVDLLDAPCTKQFTRAAPFPCVMPWQASMIKTLFRNSGAYGKLGVHRPLKRAESAKPVWVNGSGKTLPELYQDKGVITYGARAGNALAQLNHYSVRSAKGFLAKTQRGLPNRAHKPVGLEYWVDRNFNQMEDVTILRHLPRLEAVLQKLKDDPVLGRLHEAALAHHQALIEELLNTEDGLRLLLQTSSTTRTDVPAAHAAEFIRRRIALNEAQYNAAAVAAAAPPDERPNEA